VHLTRYSLSNSFRIRPDWAYLCLWQRVPTVDDEICTKDEWPVISAEQVEPTCTRGKGARVTREVEVDLGGHQTRCRDYSDAVRTPLSSRGSPVRPSTAISNAVLRTPGPAPMSVSKKPGDTVFTRAKSFHSTARDLERWMTATKPGQKIDLKTRNKVWDRRARCRTSLNGKETRLLSSRYTPPG
jgi:hypothetical protein